MSRIFVLTVAELCVIIANENEINIKKEDLMKFENGQGQHMKRVKADNRALIQEWLSVNKGSMMDCSKDTGISYATVRAHYAEMRVEQEAE